MPALFTAEAEFTPALCLFPRSAHLLFVVGLIICLTVSVSSNESAVYILAINYPCRGCFIDKFILWYNKVCLNSSPTLVGFRTRWVWGEFY